MSARRYKVVFSGEILIGRDLGEVKRNLAALYKMEVSRIEKLFSGKPVIVKKDIDHVTALQYAAAFEQAGAHCQVRAIGGSEATVPSEPTSGSPESVESPESDESPESPGLESPEEEEKSRVLSIQSLLGEFQGFGQTMTESSQPLQGAIPSDDAAESEIDNTPPPPPQPPEPSAAGNVPLPIQDYAEKSAAPSLFRVIYKGDITPGEDPARVKQNLADLFRTDVQDIDILFGGQSLVIKDRANRETALQYVQLMRKAGAVAEMKEIIESRATGMDDTGTRDLQEVLVIKERALWELKKLEDKFVAVHKHRQAFLNALSEHKQAMQNMLNFNPLRNKRADQVHVRQAVARVQQTMQAYNQLAQEIVLNDKIALAVPKGTLRGAAARLDSSINLQDNALFEDLDSNEKVEALSIRNIHLKEILLTYVKVCRAEKKIEKIRENAAADFNKLAQSQKPKS